MIWLLATLVAVALCDCVVLNASDANYCARFVAQYSSSVYVNENPVSQGPYNTILQQYCDIFLEFNFRQFYFPFACALAFPRCDPATGTALLLCPSGPTGCSSKLPEHICQAQLPLAAPGQPCTPIGDPFYITGAAGPGAAASSALLLLLLLLAAI